MRNFKLVYLLLVLFLISCGNRSDNKLNTEKDNTDDDHYLVLITGDTLKTKVPLKLEGKRTLLNESGVIKTKLKKFPKVVKSKNSPEKIKNTKTTLVSLNQKLKQRGVSEIPQPKDTILDGNKSTVFFPKPVKSEKPLYRDNAILDIQWMDVDQGLNSSYVVYTFEDSRNNMWIGYYGGGVSKFDGVEFLHFTEKEGLFNNYVWTIYEDSKYNLWFGHYSGGVTKYRH